ncbi:MAG TPA: ABC transporter transmembrane domain-containing protein, partial [Clostridia bacterium]|nr:ABC transporter transmembrane domain-containing protein [Clostridia bacterium]
MSLLRFIFRTCRGMMLFTTITALLSGACNAGLVALVNTALTHSQSMSKAIIWAFVGLGIGKVVTNYASQIVLARFSQNAIATLRRDLIRKILAVPLRRLEEMGSPRILVALTDDVFNITQALLAIPIVSVNLAILLGGAVYLGWLSWQILLGILAIIVLGGVGYRLMVARAFRSLNLAREEEDRLFGYFRALTEGIKELKLHRRRRKAFFYEN